MVQVTHKNKKQVPTKMKIQQYNAQALQMSDIGKDSKRCGCANHFKMLCRSNSRLAPKETGSERHRAVHDMCQDSDEGEA